MPPIPHATLTGVKFGLLSPEDVLSRSVLRLETEPSAGNKRTTVMNNGRLGTLSSNILCATCGNSTVKCAGHHASLRLAHPVLNISFISHITKALSLVCLRCSRSLLPSTHPKVMAARATCGQQSYKRVLNTLFMLTRRKTCWPAKSDSPPTLLSMAEANRRGYCGAEQPVQWSKEGILIRPIFANIETLEQLPCITPTHMVNILRNISPADQSMMGFGTGSKMSSMFITQLLVPSVLTRPQRSGGGSQSGQDDLTTRLSIIHKTNEALLKDMDSADTVNISLAFTTRPPDDVTTRADELYRIEAQPPSKRHLKNKKSLVPAALDGWFELSRQIAAYYDDKYQTSFDLDYGSLLGSIKTRFSASRTRRGRIRGNLLGKRGDFTARAVISPGNLILQPDEVGVPISVLSRLTQPMRVTKLNFEQALALVHRGNTYPGCSYTERDGQLMLPYALPEGLRIGDIVHRHLQKGDYVVINRQPSLHRFSMLACRVVPVTGHTFRIHLALTTALNADFDGDECNIFSLASLETIAECQTLLAVSMNLTKDGVLLIGFVQHAVLGAYLLTVPGIVWRIEDVYQLFIGTGPSTALDRALSDMKPLRDSGVRFLTGQEVASLATNGIYQPGSILHKARLNQLFFNVLRNGRRQDGARFTALIGFATRVFDRVSALNGASIDVNQCVVQISQSTLSQIKEWKQQAIKVQTTMLETQTAGVKAAAERTVNQLLSAIRDAAGLDALSQLRDRYPTGQCALLDIVESGAKGNVSNITQNTALVGQQFDGLSCQRFPPQTHHTADIVDARGFIRNSFMTGLSATECFAHHRSSRDGLVHTSVSTASTGYLTRRLCKNLEDLTMSQGGVVKDARGNVVMVEYGFDNRHATFHSPQLWTMSPTQILARYSTNSNPSIAIVDGEGDIDEIEHLLMLHYQQQRKLNIHTLTMPTPLVWHELVTLVPAQEGDDSVSVPDKEIRENVVQLWKRLSHETDMPTSLTFESAFFVGLSTSTLKDGALTHSTARFSRLLRFVYNTISDNIVPVGEAVGIIASQDYSCPLTQRSLDSFHVSGEASMLCSGVKRITELINCMSKPSTPSMDVVVQRGVQFDAKSLVQMTLGRLMKSWYIDTSPTTDPSDPPTPTHNMVLVLDKPLLMARGMPPRIVAEHMQRLPTVLKLCPGSQITASSVHDVEWAITIHIRQECTDVFLPGMHIKMALLVLYGKLQKYKTAFAGVDGIMDVTVGERSYTSIINGIPTTELRTVITTMGSNLSAIMVHPGVDSRLTTSNNLCEVVAVLGIDAGYSVLIKGLSENGTITAHVRLISSYITRTGALRALTFLGMSKSSEVSLLKLSSFERSMETFTLTAASGHHDTLQGVSEAIIFAARVQCGTGNKSFGTINTPWHSSLPQIRTSKQPLPVPTVTNDISSRESITWCSTASVPTTTNRRGKRKPTIAPTAQKRNNKRVMTAKNRRVKNTVK